MPQNKDLFIGLILLICDQIIKSIAFYYGLAVINHNLAFSIPFPLIIQVNFIVLILIAILIYKLKIRWSWLIIVGGISNLIDRIVYGGVVDFIKVLELPVFNISDIYIAFGILLVIISLFRNVTNK